ncbi:MAG: class I SAM-dependent methyltransferase [Deltaproteobacteria bacterium]|nr:MAG: class I SAM-dependent methyltransferase [Deltaproteobacteria bacterium]
MVQRLEPSLLREMATRLSRHDRDEMAIPSYLHPNPVLRWMAWRRVEVVGRLLQRTCPPGGVVLDFGCGTGVLFEAALARADRVYGVDLVLDAAALLVQRRGLGGVILVPAAEAEARIAENSVDVVVAAEVLEHLDDLAATLGFFRRVLRPGGHLLVSLPTENRAYRFGRRLAGFTGEYHEHDADSVHAALAAAGWRRVLRRRIPLPGPLTIYEVGAYQP